MARTDSIDGIQSQLEGIAFKALSLRRSLLDERITTPGLNVYPATGLCAGLDDLMTKAIRMVADLRVELNKLP